jgi:hypothetical protein
MEFFKRVGNYLNTNDVSFEADFKHIEWFWNCGCK